MRWCSAQNHSAGVKLNDILSNAQCINHSSQNPDLTVRSACGRWDECEENDLYFAINEADIDGHDYVSEAINRGAKAVVCERLLPASVPQYLVDDTREAYSQVCQALAGHPSQRMNLIGVAGSVGKTVTSHLVQNILENSGRRTGIAGSIELRCGDYHRQEPVSFNSPSIANQLSRMCIGRCSHAVLEMPSVPLAQRAFSGVALDAAVITNIQRNELATHGCLENCQRANARILDSLKPTGFAVFNADDRYSSEILNDSSSPTLTFGIHKAAEVSAKILERNTSFQTFMISAGGESIAVRTNVIGKHHIYNCLAAATVALTLGIELHEIAAGLETATLPGRLERVDCGQDFGVWIDSSFSPNQLNGAISAIAPICEGRLWCVCATSTNQTPEERRTIGEILERKIEKPIISQLSMSSGLDFEPCHQILDGFKKPEIAHVMPDRRKAIEWALISAKPKDAVLIVGAGEKPTLINGAALTDREICQSFLCEKGNHLNMLKQEIYRMDDYR